MDRSSIKLKEYMAAGPGEEIDAAHYDWAWNSPSAGGASWVPVGSPLPDSIFSNVNVAHSADTTGDNPWALVPDALPHMEYAPTDAGHVVRTDLPALKGFPDAPETVPAGSHVHVMLDRGALTTAYPC